MYFYILNGDTQLTPIGAMVFKDEHADHSEGKQSNRQSRDHYTRSASGQESHIINFLSANLATYPEFTSSCETKTATEEDISFKVIGRAYNAPFNRFD